MTWREFPPGFAAVLVSQLCFAQAPPVGEPKPAADQTAAPADTTQTPADAESAPAKRARKTSEEEIVVTGSRVRRKDLTTPAPVTVLTRESIQASGRVSIGDFLQTLPEQGNAINTTFNNGGNGSTRVSLRGLGAPRTLVLLNGRRFVPGGTGADASVDLNSVPTNAIERVEVLKDGASAVYGSDAIGGVINLITRKRYTGAEVAGYAGASTYGDGATYEVNGSAGTSGERGNLLFTVGYANQKSVMSGDRPWATLPLRYETLRGVITEGSPTGPTAVITVPPNERGVPNGNAAWNDLMS